MSVEEGKGYCVYVECRVACVCGDVHLRRSMLAFVSRVERGSLGLGLGGEGGFETGVQGLIFRRGFLLGEK